MDSMIEQEESEASSRDIKGLIREYGDDDAQMEEAYELQNTLQGPFKANQIQISSDQQFNEILKQELAIIESESNEQIELSDKSSSDSVLDRGSSAVRGNESEENFRHSIEKEWTPSQSSRSTK